MAFKKTNRKPYRSKYNNRKVEYDGMVFDSKKEAQRWRYLEEMQNEGKIKNLQRQVKFLLIKTQREPDTIGPRGGIKKGKVIERECDFIADFVYMDANTNEMIVEDIKGYKQEGAYKVFTIKRKLMLERYGIRVKEL